MLPTNAQAIQLPTFAVSPIIPRDTDELRCALNSTSIRAVYNYALGPRGTNMMQAAGRWVDRMGIPAKSHMIACGRAEQALALARATTEEGVLGVFWTCAVYYRLFELFFENPDVLPFAFVETLSLDNMQLSCRPELAPAFPSAASAWRILSHPSPAPLVGHLGCQVVKADSNAEAAVRCAAGEAEACITTETARQLYGLVKLHSFGSPEMIFFGGICQRGAKLIGQALAPAGPPKNSLDSTGTAEAAVARDSKAVLPQERS